MDTKQGKMLHSLRSARAFLDDHAHHLGSVVTSGTRMRLDDAIRELASHRATQVGSHLDARSLTQRQNELRKILLEDHMTPIARIAIADLPNTQEMRPLRMPRGRLTLEKLVGVAHGMADTAAKFSDTFVSAGLPLDFAVQLKAAADALVVTTDERTRSRRQRSGATKGLQTKLSNGRRVVDVLDAFVVTALKGKAPLLAEWNAIRRVPGLATRQPQSAAPSETPAAEVK